MLDGPEMTVFAMIGLKKTVFNGWFQQLLSGVPCLDGSVCVERCPECDMFSGAASIQSS